MKYMSAALDRSHIAGSDKDEFLALIQSLRKQIVEKADY